jgi:hypothetical protein
MTDYIQRLSDDRTAREYRPQVDATDPAPLRHVFGWPDLNIMRAAGILDSVDMRILETWETSPMASCRDMAKMIGVSHAAAHKRMRKIREIIKKLIK